jgi:hypothetical protein
MVMIKKIGIVTLATMALMLSGCGGDSDGSSDDLSSADTLSASTENLRNNGDTFAPKIVSFEVTGNSTPQNGKVVVSKSKKGGVFSYKVVLKDAVYANRVYTQLVDGTRSIIIDYDLSQGDKLDFKCRVDAVGAEGKGVDYTCEDISINNTAGDRDTFMQVLVCNSDEDKCSNAGVPILFTE